MNPRVANRLSVAPCSKEMAVRECNRSQSGFTLLELVMVIVIIGIIGATGARLLTGGVEAYETGRKQLATLSKARYAADRLAWEIRQTEYTGASYNITSFTSSQFRFVKTDGETVTLNSSGGNIQLTYNSVGFASPLTDQLSSLTFSYYQSDGQTAATVASQIRYVEASFTLDNGVATFPRRVRVALREKP